MKTPEKVVASLVEIAQNRPLVEEYNKYWNLLTPKNNEDIADRYIFSFLSVHTPWSANVSSFLLLKRNKHVLGNKEELIDLLKESRAGNYSTKARGIYEFNKRFQNEPDFYKLHGDMSDANKRDIVMKDCYGLGLAKTAFAMEMCFPLTAKCVCLDTHILQLYGYTEPKERNKVSSNVKMYHAMEQHWLGTCNDLDVSPVIARAIWWDKKQQQNNSRYWSYVIE